MPEEEGAGLFLAGLCSGVFFFHTSSTVEEGPSVYEAVYRYQSLHDRDLQGLYSHPKTSEKIDVIPLLHTVTARFSFSNIFFPSVSALVHASPSFADCVCHLFLALYNEAYFLPTTPNSAILSPLLFYFYVSS